MDETIRLSVPDNVAIWMQTKAQESHGGDVAAFVAGLLTREHERDSHRMTPEQKREASRKYNEWQTNLPADDLEQLAVFEEIVGRGALKRAEELRQRAADAAR